MHQGELLHVSRSTGGFCARRSSCREVTAEGEESPGHTLNRISRVEGSLWPSIVEASLRRIMPQALRSNPPRGSSVTCLQGSPNALQSVSIQNLNRIAAINAPVKNSNIVLCGIARVAKMRVCNATTRFARGTVCAFYIVHGL